MSNLNKYGELEGDRCPDCGKPIKPGWKACPECGHSFSVQRAPKRPAQSSAQVAEVEPRRFSGAD